MLIGKNKDDSEILAEDFMGRIPKKMTKYQQKRPSVSSSGLCGRQVCLNASLYTREEEVGPAFKFYVEIGEKIEEVVQEIYGEDSVCSNIRFDDNEFTGQTTPLNDLPLFEGLPCTLGGEFDCIVKVNNKPYLLEVKSTGSLKNYKKNHPYESQAKVYSAVTGFLDTYILYISRNVRDSFNEDLSYKFVKVDTSKDSLIKAIGVTVYGYLAAQRGILADKLRGIKKSHCGYCEFKNLCWEDDESIAEGLIVDDSMSLELKNVALNYARDYVSNIDKRNKMVRKALGIN